MLEVYIVAKTLNYSEGPTIVRPKTGPGSVRSLQKSYQYKAGNGAKSRKEQYEDIYGTAAEQKQTIQLTRKQEIAVARKKALTGPKVDATGKYVATSLRQDRPTKTDISVSKITGKDFWRPSYDYDPRTKTLISDSGKTTSETAFLPKGIIYICNYPIIWSELLQM